MLEEIALLNHMYNFVNQKTLRVQCDGSANHPYLIIAYYKRIKLLTVSNKCAQLLFFFKDFLFVYFSC